MFPAREQTAVKVTLLAESVAEHWRRHGVFGNAERQWLIDPHRVLQRMVYRHPLVTHTSRSPPSGVTARSAASGGPITAAFIWGYGFHEDGVDRAIAVAQTLEDKSESCIAASTKAESGTAVLAP